MQVWRSMGNWLTRWRSHTLLHHFVRLNENWLWVLGGLQVFACCLIALTPALTDVNECWRYPGRLCAQTCENTPGSYHCSCTAGFSLTFDGKNCEGKFFFFLTFFFFMFPTYREFIYHLIQVRCPVFLQLMHEAKALVRAWHQKPNRLQRDLGDCIMIESSFSPSTPLLSVKTVFW